MLQTLGTVAQFESLLLYENLSTFEDFHDNELLKRLRNFEMSCISCSSTR